MKSEIGYFSIFGCTMYVHVLVEKKRKLDPSIVKGIFVGYSETSKVYSVFIPAQRKTIISRNVRFEDG